MDFLVFNILTILIVSNTSILSLGQGINPVGKEFREHGNKTPLK